MEIITIVLAIIFLIISIIKSRDKTKEAIKFARGMFIKTFIDLIGILLIVSCILTLLPPDLIKRVLGESNGILSTFWGTLIGTISIIPAFIAFPLSKSILDSGAVITSVAGFLTTLTMVGIATFPIEVKHFGVKFTLFRNLFSFVGALIISFLLGGLM